MAVEKVKVPDLGGAEDVEVIDVLVSEGDEVQQEDGLITLETDKASMDVPSPLAGTVKSIQVKQGDTVSEGSLILEMDVADEGGADKEEASEAEAAEAEQADKPAAAPSESGQQQPGGQGGVQEVKVPDMGGAEDVEVIDVLVSEGDEVQEEDGLITLETDKASMDVPSPVAGKVKSLKLKQGDTVSEGSVILEMEVAGDSAQQAAKAESGQPGGAAGEEAQARIDESGHDERAEAASGGTAVESVNVPDLGGADNVEIIDVLVSEGDEIQEDEGLITLETDKASMDVPAPKAGKIVGLKVKQGDRVSEGDPILDLEVQQAAPRQEAPKAAEKPSAQAAEPRAQEKKEPAGVAEPPVSQAVPKPSSNDEVYAGPAVRKLARELGVDLTQVQGSGTKNRIVKEDVHEYVKSRMQEGGGQAQPAAGGGAGLPAVPDIDFSQFGEIEEVDMSKLQQVTAQNMSRAWLNVPHVTQFDEADVTELEEFRAGQKKAAEKKGVKLTPLPFIIKACAKALTEHPQFNVSLHSSGKKLIRKKYVHIGVAVATPAGLMVPVVRDADKKSVWEIAAEVGELSQKAKDRKLKREDMEGACFTVSSLGGIGGTGFTPIVPAPEVAILGVSKTTVKPVYQDGEFVPRQMMPFSLSYDHRAVNGVDGGMFCTYLSNVLGDLRLLIM